MFYPHIWSGAEPPRFQKIANAQLLLFYMEIRENDQYLLFPLPTSNTQETVGINKGRKLVYWIYRTKICPNP